LKNICKNFEKDKKTNKKCLSEFEKSMNDDFNTPKALQVLWNLVRDENTDGKIQTIKKMDEVFGLNLLKKKKFSIPPNIKTLAEERQKARSEKDFGKADELRDKINTLGYLIEDMGEKYSIKKRDLHEKS
jgi:cysteinyl-tRNA synthetase